VIGLADLNGLWRLIRRIEDARAGLTGHLQGTSRWLPDGDGLRQEEEGVLRYGTGAPMQAMRVYLWRETPEGLTVFFEDGRPFHRLAAAQLSDRHRCAPDTYDVSYDFSGWPDWTQVCRVTGPRKDAVITSMFQPLG
jgi:hypothetical protein